MVSFDAGCHRSPGLVHDFEQRLIRKHVQPGMTFALPGKDPGLRGRVTIEWRATPGGADPPAHLRGANLARRGDHLRCDRQPAFELLLGE